MTSRLVFDSVGRSRHQLALTYRYDGPVVSEEQKAAARPVPPLGAIPHELYDQIRP